MTGCGKATFGCKRAGPRGTAVFPGTAPFGQLVTPASGHEDFPGVTCSLFLLHFSDFVLDLFPHVTMNRQPYLTLRALKRGSFLHDFERECILLPADRARDWNLLFLHCILRSLELWEIARM